ncbi:MAG: RecX family transcriptional regulator [Clostridia bacterium]|nr:RecX family transcriptional regulator [Clostridia bacterium]
MPTITRICEQEKDKTRCSLYLDGAFYCGLTLESVMRAGLKVGMHVEPSALDCIQEESEKETALEKAYRHLSHSMKTEKDMRAFLKKKGYVDSVIEFVMEKLETHGLIDDSEYAARYTSCASKTKGKKLIAMELRMKGVGDEEIGRALEPLADESASARAVYEKYMRGKDDTKENRYKAMRYLIGKGFDYETAKEVISFDEDGDS